MKIPKQIFLVILLGSLFLPLHAQLILGAEFGPRVHLSRSNDPNGMVKTPPFGVMPYMGMTLGYKVDRHVEFQSGITLGEMVRGFDLQNPVTGQSFFTIHSAAVSYVQIPLRVRYYIPVVKDNCALFVQGGYMAGFGTGMYKTNDFTLLPTQNDPDFRATEKTVYPHGKFFNSAEAGMGLVVNTPKGISFSWTAAWHPGLREVIHTQLSYQVDNNPITQADIRSNGSYLRSSLGINYHLGYIRKKYSCTPA
ncbi:MAG: hypothetical protein H6581_29805 [Bacteroidia bacterium]|nr:hypothetical protein [Bacteroidia bacterium]